MARVNVLREVRAGDIGEWQLCFHWCRYWLDDRSIQYGYRFVWRRKEDGSIQALAVRRASQALPAQRS